MKNLIDRQVTIAQPKNTCENTCEVARTANDCISRQAAIDGADAIIARDTSGNNDVVKAMTAWKSYVEALPSAQPQRKMGRWLNINESEKWECSECGRMMWFSPRLGVKPSDYRFCPNCGADMTDKEGAQNDRQNNIPVTDMD